VTSIDVVDSAVKIGLGALIAGVFSYITARSTQKRGEQAEYGKRRRDLLEKVLTMLNDFDRTYRNQKALYDTFCAAESAAERETIRKEFDSLDELLWVAFEKFADVSGCLLILGETDADAALDEYWTAANAWYETKLPDADAARATLEPLRSKVVSTRATLMERLNKAYRTP
jgi:hypothetical protein